MGGGLVTIQQIVSITFRNPAAVQAPPPLCPEILFISQAERSKKIQMNNLLEILISLNNVINDVVSDLSSYVGILCRGEIARLYLQ